jgi:hypothetical protein
MGRAWTENDIAKLKTLAGKLPVKDIAVELGRSSGATRTGPQVRTIPAAFPQRTAQTCYLGLFRTLAPIRSLTSSRNHQARRR